ncbi:MAG: acylphosphatase [Xanthomonadales bacterium]|nr:acylphosphatase [Xanthomonadales bacterium]
MKQARFLVSGRVQGVGFRAAARSEALRLGLSGHARNLRDGDVEVVAIGDEAAIESLGSWLLHGPPAARVDSLRREACNHDEPLRGFLMR